jgi:hypothetical protein
MLRIYGVKLPHSSTNGLRTVHKPCWHAGCAKIAPCRRLSLRAVNLRSVSLHNQNSPSAPCLQQASHRAGRRAC